MVALGGDPSRDRANRRHKDKLSFRSVSAEYLASAEKKLRPRSLSESRRYLTGDYFKPLHAMPIDRISRRDVATQLILIAGKSGGPTASRAKGALSAFFTWSMEFGITESNPVIATPDPGRPASRERVLSDEELVAIWRASGDDDHGRIVKLLILTGARRGEIGGMCWRELDAGVGNWTLPAARSKNGKALTLPLPPAAWRIINSVPHMFGGVVDWVFHDLRRTVATRMADLGVQPHVIEQVLNHRRGQAGIYNRSVYAREVKTALASGPIASIHWPTAASG